MAIEIVFDVFITNEYGVETNVTDKINSYKEVRKVGMVYNVCEFVLVDFQLPKTLSQDGVVRIRVERVIDLVSFSANYIIDDLTTNSKSQLKVIGKTQGALLFEPYILPNDAILNYSTYNEVLIHLLGGLPYTMLIPPIPNITNFYEISSNTYGSELVTITEKLGIDMYIKDGNIVFEAMKTIQPNDVGVLNFTQGDCTSVSLANKKSGGVGIISINPENADITSEASTALMVSLEPQPVRPSTIRTWIDPQTNDSYNIVPQDCKMVIFQNPLDAGEPTISGLTFTLEPNYYMVEEFSLVEESYVTLHGGIISVGGVTITDGSESTVTATSSATYTNDNPYSEIVQFVAVPTTDDLSVDNGILITVNESNLDQPISSTISGTGTTIDPYIYDIFLGTLENVVGVKSTATLNILSRYSFSEITETLYVEAKDTGVSLNGYNIKIDGSGATQTSGYTHSGVETIFYLDPNKVYGSIATVIYFEIINSSTLPYTATLGNTENTLETRTLQELYVAGTLSGGVDEVYEAQRDNMAITNFVRTDPNADGILTVEASTDTTNPVVLPSTIETLGGIGEVSALSSSFGDWDYEVNHNILHFDQNITGTVRVGYTTNVYVTTIPNSEYQKNVPLKISFLDSILKFTHEIRAIDYFPLSYVHRLDISETWTIDYINSRYAPITLNKVNNYSGVESYLTTLTADATGIIMLHLGAYGYGQYSLTPTGKPTLYIRYYANLYEISWDKIIIKEAEVTECG